MPSIVQQNCQRFLDSLVGLSLLAEGSQVMQFQVWAMQFHNNVKPFVHAVSRAEDTQIPTTTTRKSEHFLVGDLPELVNLNVVEDPLAGAEPPRPDDDDSMTLPLAISCHFHSVLKSERVRLSGGRCSMLC